MEGIGTEVCEVIQGAREGTHTPRLTDERERGETGRVVAYRAYVPWNNQKLSNCRYAFYIASSCLTIHYFSLLSGFYVDVMAVDLFCCLKIQLSCLPHVPSFALCLAGLLLCQVFEDCHLWLKPWEKKVFIHIQLIFLPQRVRHKTRQQGI